MYSKVTKKGRVYLAIKNPAPCIKLLSPLLQVCIPIHSATKSLPSVLWMDHLKFPAASLKKSRSPSQRFVFIAYIFVDGSKMLHYQCAMIWQQSKLHTFCWSISEQYKVIQGVTFALSVCTEALRFLAIFDLSRWPQKILNPLGYFPDNPLQHLVRYLGNLHRMFIGLHCKYCQTTDGHDKSFAKVVKTSDNSPNTASF